MSWSEKLKARWKLESNTQLALVFLVFCLAGSSCVFVRKPIFELMGVDGDTNIFARIGLWLLIIFPSYQILLLFWGFILGQWRFVWSFEKKMLRRFRLIRTS